MNAAEIRAEAIERIARDSYESWRAVFNGLPVYEDDPPPALPYDEAPDDYHPKRASRRTAVEAVDALGDLLPTKAEWGYHCGECGADDASEDACTPGEPCVYSPDRSVIRKIRSGCDTQRRYVTAWRPIEGTEAA